MAVVDEQPDPGSQPRVHAETVVTRQRANLDSSARAQRGEGAPARTSWILTLPVTRTGGSTAAATTTSAPSQRGFIIMSFCNRDAWEAMTPDPVSEFGLVVGSIFLQDRVFFPIVEPDPSGFSGNRACAHGRHCCCSWFTGGRNAEELSVAGGTGRCDAIQAGRRGKT